MSFPFTINNRTTLSKHTSIFNLRLWIVILISIAILVVLLCLFIFFLLRRRHKKKQPSLAASPSQKLLLAEMRSKQREFSSDLNVSRRRLCFEESRCRSSSRMMMQCSRFSVEDVEVMTNGFVKESEIGSGDNGVVYRGVLLNLNARIAVKKLLSNCSQAEEFITEVESIGQIRHQNLVKLLGYCVEGYNRLLVHEYIDNGSLYQWLHGSIGLARPLQWSTRLKIIQGIARGLTYLHRDIEPKIVHQNIKSSNILLDHQWNPKISDVGLAKLHSPEWSRTTYNQLYKKGYLAPEDDSISCELDEKKSDVYSFGILIMEIVTGKMPVDHSQPHVYVKEWVKSMVVKQKVEFVLDPKLPECPSIKGVKRIVLIALRCVDPDVEHRPKMEDIIHMLEPRDLLLDENHRIKSENPYYVYPKENQTASSISTNNTEDG